MDKLLFHYKDKPSDWQIVNLTLSLVAVIFSMREIFIHGNTIMAVWGAIYFIFSIIVAVNSPGVELKLYDGYLEVKSLFIGTRYRIKNTEIQSIRGYSEQAYSLWRGSGEVIPHQRKGWIRLIGGESNGSVVIRTTDNNFLFSCICPNQVAETLRTMMGITASEVEPPFSSS